MTANIYTDQTPKETYPYFFVTNIGLTTLGCVLTVALYMLFLLVVARRRGWRIRSRSEIEERNIAMLEMIWEADSVRLRHLQRVCRGVPPQQRRPDPQQRLYL